MDNSLPGSKLDRLKKTVLWLMAISLVATVVLAVIGLFQSYSAVDHSHPFADNLAIANHARGFIAVSLFFRTVFIGTLVLLLIITLYESYSKKSKQHE